VKLKTVIASFILCLGSFAKAQGNLVLNPSFEQHTQCPTQYSQINYCNDWYNAGGTCDYYSALGCTGNYAPPFIKPGSNLTWYQQPLSGQSYMGFIPYYNTINNISFLEYLQGKFGLSLVAGKVYYVAFYINSVSQVKYFIHDIAALITDTAGLINTSNIQTYTPQILPLPNKIYSDTTNWMRIAGYYTAHGGENYITIGNYTTFGQELKDSAVNYDPSLSAGVYYFIDSVGVYEVTHLDAWDAGPDKYINYGDSVQIGNPNTDLSMFDWTNSINDITYLNDSTNANPWSKPWQTTTYYVKKTQGANVFKDTVTVHVTGGNGIQQISNNNMQVTVYPNPAKDKIYIESKEIVEIKIVTVLGEELIDTKSKEIDVSAFTEGVYLYTIINQQGLIKTGIIIK
jgi:hypothetical protein